jgi:hypothetical protein
MKRVVEIIYEERDGKTVELRRELVDPACLVFSPYLRQNDGTMVALGPLMNGEQPKFAVEDL